MNSAEVKVKGDGKSGGSGGRGSKKVIGERKTEGLTQKLGGRHI